MGKIYNDSDVKNGIGLLVDYLTKDPASAAAKVMLSSVIKFIEIVLIANKDDIRYTNVLTFRERDNWLQGTHTDWGNHRINMEIESVVEKQEKKVEEKTDDVEKP